MKTQKKRMGGLIVLALVAIVLGACASQVIGADATQTAPTTQTDQDPAMQLAAGTLALQGTENAITAEQAPELRTLWKAYASLSEADGVADAELDAVLNQITEYLTDAQVAAIESYAFDAASMQELIGAASTNGASEGAETGTGRGGGTGMGMGQGGGDVTQLTEEQIAEMRAEREASGSNPMTLNMVNQVIEMLEVLA